MNKSDTMAFLMTFSPVIILVVAFLIFAVPAGFKAISETKPCFSDNVAEITRLREENARLRGALVAIAKIKNELCGPNWKEIEKARKIARAAIRKGDKNG